MNSVDTAQTLDSKGFLDVEVDPAMDLFAEIERLKKEKKAVILAHYYQDPDIQDVADYIGDSLGLSQEAARSDADIIVFAGVHFMAETAKILSPSKKVLLPDLNASCSLAQSCPAELFSTFRAMHPEHAVVMYVNCSAEVKAMSDILCTSTNAMQVINSFPQEQKIIFGPDKNLGRYIAAKTGRELLLWDGSCSVHELFSEKEISRLKLRHPHAQVLAHPECVAAVLDQADFIGSTAALLQFTRQSECKEFIVATEPGIIHQMQKSSPHKLFFAAPADNSCGCNECPYMRLNTLEKLYLCLKYELPEVTVSDSIAQLARKPIERMLELSAK